MGFIIKDTAALINSKLTDAGRKKISEGGFNISYFQVGDSEVCYDCISGADLSTGMVLDSEYNAQNLSPLPQKSKSNVKYPLLVTDQSTNTYGIPIAEPVIDNIYNTASTLGFFTGNTTYSYSNVVDNDFSAFTSTAYTINPNFVINMTTLNSGDTVSLSASTIDINVSGNVTTNHFMTVFFSDGTQPINNNFPVLTYKVVGITGDTSGNTGSVTVKVDRQFPDLQSMGYTGNARVIFYPSGMTELYDTFTPEFYWDQDAINFESNCDISNYFVKVWNMNIPWTENPAGIFTNNNQGYEEFGSTGYTGTKEYLGYNSDTGQTDTDSTYYYNSFSEKVILSPSDQKSIAIVHYTNQSIDNFYGEKFAMTYVDPLYSLSGQTGPGRRFRVNLPTLMWHKSSGGTMGETFYVDPDGYGDKNLYTPHYIESNVNIDMNSPGIRYYHLWDTNTNSNGMPNRVGKVWPDFKMITFDDDEIIAALSNKSNRNWTLPAPKLGLVPPNSFNGTSNSDTGLLSGTSECLWVTYRFNNSAFTQSLHCNYYTLVCGTDPDCPPDTADVTFRLGNEFPYMVSDGSQSGFSANELVVLVQRVGPGERPDPTGWYEIDLTPQMSATTTNGYLTVSGITGTTFVINKQMYDNVDGGPTYNLNNYITLPTNNQTGPTLNFGDEYYFYGNISSDIQATIYVMNYKCNLGPTQFLKSQNPTWSTGQAPYVTEVGLYDSNKELMIISKIQSPEKRLGVQQYTIKLDF
jgi:hypothetical protein